MGQFIQKVSRRLAALSRSHRSSSTPLEYLLAEEARLIFTAARSPFDYREGDAECSRLSRVRLCETVVDLR